MNKKPKYPTCIDIFCGCGGASLGFLKAGWEVVAALDSSPDAISTYYANLCDENTKIIGDIPRKSQKWFGKPHGCRANLISHDSIPPVRALFIKDVLNVSGWEIMDAAGIEKVDAVIGSPPCQSFSQANTQKKKGDLRDFLLFEFGRLILEINPDTFMMENVPPIVKAKLPNGRNIIKTFNEMVKGCDWDLYYEIQGMYPEEAWHTISKGKRWEIVRVSEQ